MVSEEHLGGIRRIDNKTMFSLMFSYLMLIIALQPSLYVWSSLLTVLLVLWRFLYMQRKTSLPTPAVLNILALLCCAMIVVSSISAGILNGMTNLLLLATALKMLAIHTARGVKHICLALYFTIASAFIFRQGIAFTAFVLGIFAVNTYTLLMVHSPALNFKTRSRFFLRFLLTAMPLVLFLFALMPRFGPMWKMPSAQGTTTGLSEEIAPGEFSSLAQSSELAFRVQFDGDIPENSKLYWRAMVHERFDGKQWKVDRFRKAPQNVYRVAPPLPQLKDNHIISYQVILEPTYQDWVFSLDTPIKHSSNLRYHHDRRLSSKTPVSHKLQYEVTSATRHQHQGDLFELERQINLLQPKSQNPKTQAFAQKLRARSRDDIDYINKVMSYFIDNTFVYTLEPPLMPVNPIDTFLFEAKEGFCAHYAGAFAALMRAAGIPARVVSGYQGGERAIGDTYLSVYQYEAHAWNEIWLEDRGWVLIDPTATVSPERIALGLQAAMKNDDSFLSGEFDLVKFKHLAALNWLRNQLNNIDFYWSSWVLNFDNKKQSKLFENVWGKQSTAMYGLFAGLALSGFLLFIYFLSRGKLFSEPHSAFYRSHQALNTLALRYGFERPFSTPPLSFIEQFIQYQPQLSEPLNELKALYGRYLYQRNDAHQDSELVAQINKKIKALSRKAPRRFRGFGF